MANNIQPDDRIPNPISDVDFQGFIDFFLTVPTRAAGLLDISAEDVMTIKKVSKDELEYIDDVIEAMTSPSNHVASNVEVKNIQAARLAGIRNRKIGDFLTRWGQIFTRNAIQAEGYAYQHSATFETDVASAIRSRVKGAAATKEKLVSNRKKRNAQAAATRISTAAQKTADELAKKDEKPT